jgi:hypothetical protein
LIVDYRDFSATMFSQRQGHVLPTEIKRTYVLYGAWAMLGLF